MSNVSPTQRKPGRKLTRQEAHPKIMFVLKTVAQVNQGVKMGKREIRNAQYATGSVLADRNKFKPRKMRR